MWKIIAGLQELRALWDAHICQRCKVEYTGEEYKYTPSSLTPQSNGGWVCSAMFSLVKYDYWVHQKVTTLQFSIHTILKSKNDKDRIHFSFFFPPLCSVFSKEFFLNQIFCLNLRVNEFKKKKHVCLHSSADSN